MNYRQRRFPMARTLVLGAATLTLLWLPDSAGAQSAATQDRQAVPGQDRLQPVPGDDITRRDLAQFSQFLDSHREIGDQLRKTPSLIDDPQFLGSHPELSAYLQDHPSVKQEISQRPDTFMRLEDMYARDPNLRDRDAGARDDAGGRNAGGQDRDANGRDAMNQDRDGDRRGAVNRDAESFDRFLDQHREIAEQVRKDPRLCDDRKFVDGHPALQAYLHDNPGVRDQLRQDPNAFMQQADRDNRAMNPVDRDGVGGRDVNGTFAAKQDRDADRSRSQDQDRNQDRNADQNRDENQDRNADQDRGGDHRGTENRDAMAFDRFLDEHREIGEQVRKDPSLLDNRNFVDSHPALRTYLQDNPGVRDQIRQNPNTFMQLADRDNHDMNWHGRDPMHDRMADFGGFLGNHSDIQRDLSKDPSMAKDPRYLQNHAELNTYLNAHPDVQNELMTNPQSFIRGAQQYNSGSATGNASGSGASTGAATSTSTNPASTTHVPKPNQ